MTTVVPVGQLAQHLQDSDAALVVVSFCAAWCGTCREFRPLLETLAAAEPQAVFSWADVEDDAALAGDIDVENFPTLAIFRAGQPLYFGVTLPQPQVVAQLLRVAATASAPLASIPEELTEFADQLFGER
ncbi:thioredoxin family protein [Azoarcus olearius]|uniref:Thioredoxin-disulfide reductase n=1 Tax=Azoarcus sp. (strain BH72) TaxID=418699 RepID=A1K8F2_AZOSB|nr:thioredoxin family protein [Azoarcus olearius]ANQ85673.1 thioredoxin-disulfide reductase [Azoarcus olearius]CAL95107.1 thioredoxin-disulfide reductase [Azoarcus olearius]